MVSRNLFIKGLLVIGYTFLVFSYIKNKQIKFYSFRFQKFIAYEKIASIFILLAATTTLVFSFYYFKEEKIDSIRKSNFMLVIFLLFLTAVILQICKV